MSLQLFYSKENAGKSLGLISHRNDLKWLSKDGSVAIFIAKKVFNIVNGAFYYTKLGNKKCPNCQYNKSNQKGSFVEFQTIETKSYMHETMNIDVFSCVFLVDPDWRVFCKIGFFLRSICKAPCLAFSPLFIESKKGVRLVNYNDRTLGWCRYIYVDTKCLSKRIRSIQELVSMSKTTLLFSSCKSCRALSELDTLTTKKLNVKIRINRIYLLWITIVGYR